MLRLSSFIFKRKNVRNSEGDIAFFKVWVDKWEEDREPVPPESLILHISANYSVDLEAKLMGNRRALVDVPIDMLVSRSVIEVLNGTKFIFNLVSPRRQLTDKHISYLNTIFPVYQEEGFLFSIHENLLKRSPDVIRDYGNYINYVYIESDATPHIEGKLIIRCGEKDFSYLGYDFVCEGEYEDVMIVNTLKHIQASLSKLISMLADDPSIENLAETIKGDPALVTKLLQYVNSPLFPHRKEIQDITMAINYLGLENLKKFLIAVWMSQFFGQDPEFIEFVKSMLYNAFFAEWFASKLSDVSKGQMFLAGLFYKMPSAFGVRPEVFFNSINLPKDITDLYEKEKVKAFLGLIDRLENPADLLEYAKSLGVSPEDLESARKYADENLKAFL